ncbi:MULTISPECIES: discoidin domain-containing protein [Oceanobacillus]|uniref:F5/8 type C domain-containing protein n=1 Tax=Oceanobacillus sojae TaxID=582851 RepID=A0A511ZNF8_9BACI|nr:discoidin domain-containing protein [Oceanobacillus sojae]GEN88975.1 hypothetical protein OSO01_37140 [Oceanobacillus sojae]
MKNISNYKIIMPVLVILVALIVVLITNNQNDETIDSDSEISTVNLQDAPAFDEQKIDDISYLLSLPDTVDEELVPLIIISSNNQQQVLNALADSSIQTEKKAVLINISTSISKDDLKTVVDEIRSTYSIEDSKVFGINMGDSSAITDLEADFKKLFTNVITISPDNIETEKIIAEVDNLLEQSRGIIYNSTVKHQHVSTNSNTPVVDALDESPDTVWVPEENGEKEVIIAFDNEIVVSRWQVEANQPITSMTLQTSLDGEKWTDIDVIQSNNHNRVDRILPATNAQYVRFTTDEDDIEIAELEIYAEYAVAASFSFEEYTNAAGNTMPYRLFVPDNIDQLTDIPVILSLHGSGQRGTDNNQHLGITKGEGTILWTLPEIQKEHPALVVAPQISPDQLWRDEEVMNSIEHILESLKKTYPDIDTNRIYATGVSIGAEGIYNLAIKNPDLYAALLPVAGGPNNPVGDAPPVEETVIPNISKYADIPAWLMQSYDDSVRAHTLTNELVNAYRELGYNPKYTVYLPGETEKVATSTHSSWIYAYQDERIIDWLFSQYKTDRVVPENKAYQPVEEYSEEEITQLETDRRHYIDLDEFTELVE